MCSFIELLIAYALGEIKIKVAAVQVSLKRLRWLPFTRRSSQYQSQIHLNRHDHAVLNEQGHLSRVT